VREVQRVAAKLGPAKVGRRALAPSVAARRALLGPAAEGPPRFLVRVDEYPCAFAFDEPDRYGPEESARFHAVLADAGVPYLMAVVPQLVAQPLNPTASGGRPLGPEEEQLLRRMQDDGVVFAAHGLTHRTRQARPRRHSELLGLSTAEAGELADQSLSLLAGLGIAPRIFVPPFNRFTAAHYEALASRFDVVTGGPETIEYLGLQPTPRWLGDAVYCPSYGSLYSTARGALAEVERLIDGRPGSWIPITLHLSWELGDRLEGLKRLVQRVAPYAVSWTEFLVAANASHERVLPASTSAG
jgi:peptidoglycan/xylan/chitin deacetylase (PgdA/CDA1 family)